MIKRYGEMKGVIFRNYGYCPYNMATKYKLSYCGEVHYIYVNNYTELKKEILKLLGDQSEED